MDSGACWATVQGVIKSRTWLNSKQQQHSRLKWLYEMIIWFMLKLKYFGHLVQNADSLEKTLTLGNTEGKWKRGWQMTRWLDDITDPMDMNLSKLRDIVKDREAWGAAVHGVTKSWTRLSHWTKNMINILIMMIDRYYDDSWPPSCSQPVLEKLW